MQCPHCAHPDYICYGTSRGVQRYRCQACRRIFKSLRRGKDPALKQKYCQLYQEGMELRAIGRYLGIHYKTVTRSLVQAAQALPWHQIKHLPTMGYGTDMLQACKISFHTPGIT